MINNESMKLCYSTHINVDLFLPPLEKRAYEILAVRVKILYYKWTWYKAIPFERTLKYWKLS